MRHVARPIVDWGPFVPVLLGLGLLAVGGYQFFEARSVWVSSTPATAVITAMKDVSTDQGYHLCYATVEVPVRTSQVHAQVRLGGYWPETGGGCGKVTDKLAVRYSQTDLADVRPADAFGSGAKQFFVMGLFFLLPLLFMGGLAGVGWWSSRSSRLRPRPVL